MIHIYALLDPRSQQVRYVGKTKRRPGIRLSEHLDKCRRRQNRLYNWLRHLLAADVRPDLLVLETVTEEEWREAEQFWIASFRLAGASLVNTAEGGQGPNGSRRTPEQVAAMRARLTGRKLTLAHRAKIAAAGMGRVKPAPAIAASAAFHRGRKRSVETRTRMSEAMRATGTTPAKAAQLERLHASLRGRPRSPETRAKIAAALRRKVFD